MPFSRSLLVALLVAAGGCSATDPVVPAPVADLLAAPLSAAVGGQALVLVPNLYRDFQPIAPPDGQPLIGILRVQASDGSALATSIQVDAAWVVNGTEVWVATVGEERLAAPTPVFYEAVARNGPKWAPGVSVDVVVRIREPSGATHLLRAAGQRIGRTD